MNPIKYALVGKENNSNFQLSNILKKAFGEENIVRFLEYQHVEPFLTNNQKSPIIIILDLFSFDVIEATDWVGRIRDTYPLVVFNLYIDQDEYRKGEHTLPDHWQKRFVHYYKIFKEDADVVYEPIVRASLRWSQWEAEYNITHDKPIRMTPVFNKGVVQPDIGRKKIKNSPISFLSYSKSDWEGFVDRLVSDLSKASHKVWNDQHYIIGGNDWMDAIGEALDECDILLLVLSPEAIGSRYVKMEYRYFLRRNKPVIPIIYRRLEKIPFDLETLQYIDFTNEDHRQSSFSNLLRVLSQYRDQNGG